MRHSNATLSRFTHHSWGLLPVGIAALLMAVIGLTGTNRSLFLLLNHAGTSLPDLFWITFTLLGDGAVTLALILLIAGRTPQQMWGAVIAALLVTLWVHGWKQSIAVPRPAAVLEAGEFFHIGPLWRGRSFPSGHAAAIFTLTGIILLQGTLSRAANLTLFVGAVLVAVSRIVVGVHWPLDVLAGFVGGWLSAWLGWRIAARPFFRRWGFCAHLVAGCLALIAVALLFIDHTRYPEAMPIQRAIATACLLFALRQWQWRWAQRKSQAGQRRRAADLTR